MVHSLYLMKLSRLSTVEVLNSSLMSRPSALWWGGMFERMMRPMKRCLKKSLGRCRIDYEQLHTLLVEV